MRHDESERLDRRAARLSALLRAADPPVPTVAYPEARIARALRRRTVVRWRVAAGIAALAACAVGVRPVRAWIVGAARALWGVAARPAARPPTPAAIAGRGRVTFTPSGSSFVVRVLHPQAAGTLTIRTASGPAASAVVDGDAAVELVVLPDGLRIVNDSGATASYVVDVPASAGRVGVAVGAGEPRPVSLVPGGRHVLDLRTAR